MVHTAVKRVLLAPVEGVTTLQSLERASLVREERPTLVHILCEEGHLT